MATPTDRDLAVHIIMAIEDYFRLATADARKPLTENEKDALWRARAVLQVRVAGS